MLDWICFAYQSVVHASTYETSYVLHGIIPFMSIDIYLGVGNTVMLVKDYESWLVQNLYTANSNNWRRWILKVKDNKWNCNIVNRQR